MSEPLTLKLWVTAIATSGFIAISSYLIADLFRAPVFEVLSLGSGAVCGVAIFALMIASIWWDL